MYDALQIVTTFLWRSLHITMWKEPYKIYSQFKSSLQ